MIKIETVYDGTEAEGAEPFKLDHAGGTFCFSPKGTAYVRLGVKVRRKRETQTKRGLRVALYDVKEKELIDLVRLKKDVDAAMKQANGNDHQLRKMFAQATKALADEDIDPRERQAALHLAAYSQNRSRCEREFQRGLDDRHIQAVPHALYQKALKTQHRYHHQMLTTTEAMGAEVRSERDRLENEVAALKAKKEQLELEKAEIEAEKAELAKAEKAAAKKAAAEKSSAEK